MFCYCNHTILVIELIKQSNTIFQKLWGPVGLDRDRKLDACSAARNGYHDNLVFCYSILEENPRSLDFLARIEIGED